MKTNTNNTIIKYLAISLFLFINTAVFGTTFTIGVGATVNASTSSTLLPCPFGNYYEGHREQFIIKATELTGVGVTTQRIITQLGFNVSTLNTCCGTGLHDFKISIKNTASTVVTTTWEAGLTQVYFDADVDPALGWNMFTLNSNFTWDGVSNLLIETCFNDEGYESFTQSAGTFYSAAGFNATHGYSIDNSAPMCGAVAAAGAVETNRVNTRLEMWDPGNMIYSSCTTTQAVTTSVIQGSIGNQIAGVEIVTDRTVSPLSVTSFTFNTTGSTNPTTDITLARLYYSGTSSTFSTATQIGTTVYSPNGVFTMTVSQALSPGTNYFWLVYNINGTATVANVVDAQCTSLNVGGARTPTVTAPAGNRAIAALVTGAYCAVTGGNSTTGNGGVYVANVSLNSINNTTLKTGAATYYNDYTSTISTTLYNGDAYQVIVDANVATAGCCYQTTYTQVWIDYNRDGTFAAGELVGQTSGTGTAGSMRLLVDFSLPASVVLGTSRMRVISSLSAYFGPCGASTNAEIEDYEVIFDEHLPMVYISSTTTQANITSVTAGTYKDQVIGLEVVTTGEVNPLTISTFTFTTAGTTTPTSDAVNAKLWSTGTSSTFATTTQIGATVAAPNGTFAFSPGSLVLGTGTNYYWITYDVPAAAPGGDVIDATCTSFVQDAVTRIPTVTAPAGNRLIIAAAVMSYVSSTCTQNTATVALGDINQQVIGIQIVTTGALTPLSATSFSLNTTGTTVNTDILNAKLWFSQDNPLFSAAVQVGSTVAVPGASFTITPTVAQGTLLQGINYFWLSYDIKSTAACIPNKVDAQCTSLTVSAVAHVPTLTNPAGNRLINCGTPYFSVGSLSVNNLSSWNSQRDGLGATPGSFSATYGFYIQNAHSMTTAAVITIPQLFIENGGYITATNLVSIDTLRIENGGIFEQKVVATISTYIKKFYIENGGTWIHNNNGQLANSSNSFAPRSNQWFYQWGGGTFPAGTAWGNVLFNGTTVGNFNLSNVMNTIQGDWEWRRIGNSNDLFSGSTETINVGGNLIFSGGTYSGMGGTTGGAKTLTLNVTGDLIISSGTFKDFRDGNSGNNTDLTVGGNVLITGGTMAFNSCPTAGLSSINLSGGTASVTWTQTGGTVTLCNTNIVSGKTVTLVGSKMGDVQGAGGTATATVNTGAKLYCSNYPVTGTGGFTLQTGTTLGIGSAAGITASGASGNVQVSGTRSFNTGATYEYYEGLTPQSTGNFTTTTTSATYPAQVANLIINKTSASNIVNLTSTTDVNTLLTLTNGILTTSYTAATAPWLRIPTDVATVSPVGGSINSYVDGYMRKTGAAAFIYPTGNGGKWRRIAQTAPSASTEFEAKYVASTYSNTTTMAVAPATILTHVSVVEHWFLSKPLGATASTTKVTLYWEDAAASGILKFDSLAVGRWSGTGWENANCYGSCPANWTSSTAERTYTGSATGSGIGTITSNTISSFSPFTFSSVGVQILNPLPIELLSFTANLNTSQINLSWTTATETNNDYFTIEKSQDAQSFVKVFNVDGAGNSTSLIDYFDIDHNPYIGISYYRLKQTDFNGKTSYSNIVPVEYNPNGDPSISLFPNPTDAGATTYLSLNQLKGQEVLVVLRDIAGREIFSKVILSNSNNELIAIDLQGTLAKGSYLITATSANQFYNKKLIVK